MTTPVSRRSSPRLKGFDYQGLHAYLVTANAKDSQSYFVDSAFASACIDDLEQLARVEHFEVLAYCFMPNHVHLLVQGEREESDLGSFMKRFKQLTGYRFKRSTGKQLWHRSYHDRILRREESVQEIANYIWHNPVRAALVADPTAYPYSGPPTRFHDRPEGLSVRETVEARGLARATD